MRTDPGITSYRQRLRPKIIVPLLAALLLAIGTCAFVSASVLVDTLDRISREVSSDFASNLSNQTEIHRDIEFRDADRLNLRLHEAQGLSENILSIAVYRRVDGQQKFELFADARRTRVPELAPPSTLQWMVDGAVEFEEIHTATHEAIRVSMPVTIQAESFDLETSYEVEGAIVLCYSLAEVNRQITDYINLLIGLTILLMLFAAWATNRVAQRVLHPLHKIQLGLEQVTAGNLDERLQVTSQDELSMVASKFNTLVTTLRQNKRELTRHAELLEKRVDERTSELSDVLADLKTLDKAKDAFLSSISHEMRTPLTSIIASAEILEFFTDDDPETRREFLKVISTEAQRLIEIIGAIIDLAKLEAESVDFDLADCDMRNIADRVLESFEATARERRIVVHTDWPDDRVPVFCDAERIGQVVKRLLDNALTYSPPGGSIRLWIKKDYIMASLYIADEGPGVPLEQRERIFQKFSQSGDDVLTNKPHGVGLGLTVARSIAEAHRGILEYESVEGVGACFVLRLPALLEKPDESKDSEQQDEETADEQEPEVAS